jgi:branched-chain amino acid transport system substrate-binding protein
MKKLVCVILAITFTVGMMAFTLCSSPSHAAQAPSIKIGLIGAMTGSRAAYGAWLYGAEAMIRYINDQGGIKSMDGAKIEIIWGDSASDTATFASEVERLITKEKVVAIITGEGTAAVVGGAYLADKYQIPINSIGAVAAPVFDMKLKFWRSTYIRKSRPEEPAYDVMFITDLIKKYKVCHDRMAFGTADIDYLQNSKTTRDAQFKNLGFDKFVVFNEKFSAQLTDCTPVVAKIKAAKPNIVMVNHVAANAYLPWQSNFNLRLYYPFVKAVYFGDVTATSSDFIKLLGWQKYKEMFVDKPVFIMSNGSPTMGYAPLAKTDQILRPFLKTKNQEPVSHQYQMAQAVIAYRRAWEALGTTDPVKVNDYLRKLVLKFGDPDMIVPTYYPELSWSEAGEPNYAITGYEQVRSAPGGKKATTIENYKRVMVWPDAWKQAEPILP